MAQPTKRFNLCVVTRTYTDNQGNEKKVWQRIGELAQFQNDDGGVSLSGSLYHMPGVKISAFEQKERDNQQRSSGAAPEKEINVDDIPF